MIELKSKLESINRLFIRGCEIETHLNDIESYKKDNIKDMHLMIQMNRQRQIQVNENIRDAVLAIVENNLEQEIETIYNELKAHNIGRKDLNA
jgi:hypothetical protein